MDKYVISDIHGSYNKFEELLNKINLEDYTKLIILGDMIDRGKNNVKTILKCMELQKKGAIILKGNHEYFLENFLSSYFSGVQSTNEHYIWLNNGGYATYNEIMKLSDDDKMKIFVFIKELKLYYECENYIFVHAGINVNMNIENNTSDDLLWIRDEFIYRKSYENKIVIFGHTPTMHLYEYGKIKNIKESKIWYDKKFNDKIGIDCACCFGGRLSCLSLKDKKEFYA